MQLPYRRAGLRFLVGSFVVIPPQQVAEERTRSNRCADARMIQDAGFRRLWASGGRAGLATLHRSLTRFGFPHPTLSREGGAYALSLHGLIFASVFASAAFATSVS
jgi:hypothetical protein